MKQLLIAALALVLAGCSGASVQPSLNPAFPVALTHLGATVDPATAQVDVQITVRSGFPRTLKTLRIVVALFDGSGAQMGSEQAIEILGPIVDGQSIGPLEKVTSVRDPSFSCLMVVQIDAVMMDYATRTLSGTQANALVQGGPGKLCSAPRR